MEKNQSNRSYSRREMLRVLSLGSAAVFFSYDQLRSISNQSPDLAYGAQAASLPSCVVRPEQTEGPYFVDEKLNRSDIRNEPSDNSSKPGVPLRLEFQVSRIAGGACAPLNGAIVDVWHCDALGVYSDVRDSKFDARGKKFLRGYQQTDTNGPCGISYGLSRLVRRPGGAHSFQNSQCGSRRARPRVYLAALFR